MSTGYRCALYLRVSTRGQFTANQRGELEEWARKSGHQITHVFEDVGVSGRRAIDHRPQFDQMLAAASRHEFDMVAVWSVDRLGRSLVELCSMLDYLIGFGVHVYVRQIDLDTRTAAGRALFGILAVFSEFEWALFGQRIRLGITRARRNGGRHGRPRIAEDTRLAVRMLASSGLPQTEVARRTGVSRATVQREIREVPR